jgi:hypothetical protein
MAPSQKFISMFECENVRAAFRETVIESGVPQDQWRSHAMLIVRDLTGHEDIDPAALEWIVRK